MSAARRLMLKEAYQQLYPKWNPDAAPASIKRHLYDLKRWRALMGPTPLSDVTTDDYQEYRRRSAQRGDRPATTETTLSTIRLILRIAAANQIIPNVPDRGRARRIPPPTPHVPTVEEFGRLYEACDAPGLLTWPKSMISVPVWWKCLLVIGAWTALRRTDLFYALSFDHVDPTERIIHFQPSKERGRDRAFPIADAVWRHIEALEPVGPKRLLFGPSRSIDKIRRELRLLSAQAGIRPAITPQTIRRTGINLWADADEYAGQILQGSGINRVWLHYRDQLRRLDAAKDRVQLPECVENFGVMRERQLTLF